MARKAVTSKNKTKTSKTRTTRLKTKESSSRSILNYSKNVRILMFALLFGVIGTALLLITRADPKFKVDDNEIAMGYYDSRPTVISRDLATDKKTYESYTASYLILEGGTILCDDGNSEGTVTTGELGKGRVKQLKKELADLNLSTVPAATTTSTEPANTIVSTFEGYVLVNSDSVSTFSVLPGAEKPTKLEKMQEKILKECEKATTQAERGKTKEFKIPKGRSSATSQDVINKFASLLSPKASASPPAPTTINSGFSNSIVSLTNNYRTGNGRAALARVVCLNDVAHAWAKKMAEMGGSTPTHNPNLAKDVTAKCGNGWWLLGENVGIEGTCDPQKLFHAYVNSTTHRNNILDSRFNRIGVGTYKRNDNGWCYNANVFGQW